MKNIRVRIEHWVKGHYLNLAIYNVFLVLLVLLHSARYFDPFWLVSINAIVLFALVASVFLLGATCNVFFVVTLVFWVFASVLRVIGINIWAERTTVYAYQSLVLAVVLLILENSGVIKNE